MPNEERSIGRRKAASPRKPRAEGLTRDRIVDASVRYLRVHPHENLTIAKAAAEVGATKMAVYRHFRNGGDLSDAIMDKVLEGLVDEIPQNADWRPQVRAWMEAMYRRLADVPQSVNLLNSSNGLCLAWVRAAEALRGSLTRAGLRDPTLSDTTFWIGLSVIGLAQFILRMPLETHISDAVGAIQRLDPEGKSELTDVIGAMPRIYHASLSIVIERVMGSLELLIENAESRTHPPGSRSPAP